METEGPILSSADAEFRCRRRYVLYPVVEDQSQRPPQGLNCGCTSTGKLDRIRPKILCYLG